jgi:putative hydrolase of the HAD superfamily
MPASLTTIVFDLDGTLYASDSLAREIQLSAARYVAEVRDVTLDEAVKLLAETKSRLAGEAGTEVPLTRVCNELGGSSRELHLHFCRDIDPKQHLQPDGRVVALLRALKQRFSLYVYTNNNRDLAGRIVDILGCNGLFLEMFSIEYSWRPKPDSRTLQDIFAAIGVSPAESLFVGDRYDIDLKLPAEMGARVELVRTVEELLKLKTLLNEETL